ncbi:MAG: hypothetical protein ABJO30_03765 [Hyphomicrobiales bacterium]
MDSNEKLNTEEDKQFLRQLRRAAALLDAHPEFSEVVEFLDNCAHGFKDRRLNLIESYRKSRGNLHRYNNNIYEFERRVAAQTAVRILILHQICNVEEAAKRVANWTGFKKRQLAELFMETHQLAKENYGGEIGPEMKREINFMAKLGIPMYSALQWQLSNAGAPEAALEEAKVWVLERMEMKKR